MNQTEVILEVGAGGGCVQLRGQRLPDNTWRFLMERNEYMAIDMLLDEEKDGLEATEQTEWVNTFDEALRLFDRYRWHRLFPVRIHPEFRERIFEIVARRQESEINERPTDLGEWEYLCSRHAE